MTTQHIHVSVNAAPTHETLADSGLEWSGTLDDLVRFVYANQGTLFVEDAVPYRYGNNHLTVASQGEYHHGEHRVYGTWEHEKSYNRFDSEDEYNAWQDSRGDLAHGPTEIECYACGGFDGSGTGPERAVVAHGPTVNPADPTATYVLACGHVVM